MEIFTFPSFFWRGFFCVRALPLHTPPHSPPYTTPHALFHMKTKFVANRHPYFQFVQARPVQTAAAAHSSSAGGDVESLSTLSTVPSLPASSENSTVATTVSFFPWPTEIYLTSEGRVGRRCRGGGCCCFAASVLIAFSALWTVFAVYCNWSLATRAPDHFAYNPFLGTL